MPCIGIGVQNLPRNGSGVYSLPAGNPVVSGTVISSTVQNNTMSDVATALTNSIAKDGQTVPTANLPMGGFKLTNLGAGTTTTDSTRVDAVQDSDYTYLSSVSGTNTVTASASPTPDAYKIGQLFHFTPAATNTGATTLNISSLGAGAVQLNGAALEAGELRIGVPVIVMVSAATPVFQIVANGANVTQARQNVLTPSNLSIACSVGSNALTIALKTFAGSDPSTGSPILVPFRSATAASGDMDVLTISAATSLVISAGSSLGTANNVAFRFWIVGFNDGGTFRLGVINCRSGTNIYPLAGFGIASSTAEGGAGGADSAQTFYTGSAVTSKAYTVLGTLTYESGLGTAGTYASAPTRVSVYAPWMALPGAVVQVAGNQTGAVATGTTTLPYDDTIPQNTDGDQYMTQAITPNSASNVLRIQHTGSYSNSAATGSYFGTALFQDSTADALAASYSGRDVSSRATGQINLYHSMVAGTTSSTTFNIRTGWNVAGTTTFNGDNGGRVFGGVCSSVLNIQEIMA